jgi:hypothetical protein
VLPGGHPPQPDTNEQAAKWLNCGVHPLEHGFRQQRDPEFIDELIPGEVVIDVQFSEINYKDALAATVAGKIYGSLALIWRPSPDSLSNAAPCG